MRHVKVITQIEPSSSLHSQCLTHIFLIKAINGKWRAFNEIISTDDLTSEKLGLVKSSIIPHSCLCYQGLKCALFTFTSILILVKFFSMSLRD